MEEVKVKRSLRDAAKKGDQSVVKMFAKELVNSKKAKLRIEKTKAQLNSVQLQLTQQVQQLKVMGSLQKSTEIMKMMNNILNVPQISATMRDMAKEMEKAGIIEEMNDDMMESALGADDDEEEVDEAIDGVIKEVLKTSAIPSNNIAQKTKTGKQAVAEDDDVEEPVEEEEEDDDLAKRVQNLKG